MPSTTATIHDVETRTAVDALLAATPPGSRVIVFGSRARAEGDAESDLDLLVLEPEVARPLDEMARLVRVLRPFRIPADVLVASEATYAYWRDTPNTIYHAARVEGCVYEQGA